MQFLKTLFWCLLAFIAAVFTFGNWTTVQIRLWSNLIADVNLPFLLLVTFLFGFVPTLFYQRVRRWRIRQRLATTERTLSDIRTAVAPPAPVPPAPALVTTTPASVAPAGPQA